ncbi:MAG: hypothetical protein ACI9W4_000436 [Rhodothermales bacterium]|jgi:hypothetical protein
MVLYLVALMAGARVYGRFRRLTRANFVDAWQDYLASEKPPVTARILSLHPDEVHHLVRGWNLAVEQAMVLRHAGATGQTERVARLRDIAYATELTHAALALAFRGRTWDERISGIQALGLMGRKEVVDRLTLVLEGPDSLLALAAFEALIRIDERSIAERIDSVLCSHPEWPEHAVSKLILEMDEATRSVLVSQIGFQPDACVARVISTLERIHHAGATQLLRYKLSQDKPVAEKAKLLYAVQDEGHIRLVEEALLSEPGAPS